MNRFKIAFVLLLVLLFVILSKNLKNSDNPVTFEKLPNANKAFILKELVK